MNDTTPKDPLRSMVVALVEAWGPGLVTGTLAVVVEDLLAKARHTAHDVSAPYLRNALRHLDDAAALLDHLPPR
jgi:hypothetical protein